LFRHLVQTFSFSHTGALVGWLLHAPLYYAARFATGFFFDNDHYDSVVISLLMLAYPLYLLLLTILALLYIAMASMLCCFLCCCRSLHGPACCGNTSSIMRDLPPQNGCTRITLILDKLHKKVGNRFTFLKIRACF
jgi:hypothetical protein